MIYSGDLPPASSPDLKVELVDASGTVISLQSMAESRMNGKFAGIWVLFEAPTNAEYWLRVKLPITEMTVAKMPVGRLAATPPIPSYNELERGLWEDSVGAVKLRDCPLADVLTLYTELTRAQLAVQQGVDIGKSITVESQGTINRQQAVLLIEQALRKKGIKTSYVGARLISVAKEDH